MSTDEEKTKIAKLLQDLDVKENKLPERCSQLVKTLLEKQALEDTDKIESEKEIVENPYKVDKRALEEIDEKLRVLSNNKNKERTASEKSDRVPKNHDPIRPWRINTNKEKLLRINNELKRHVEKGSDLIEPLSNEEVGKLVKTCREETSAVPIGPVEAQRLRNTYDEARRCLPNFQYKTVVNNSTATDILKEAHDLSTHQPAAIS